MMPALAAADINDSPIESQIGRLAVSAVKLGQVIELEYFLRFQSDTFLGWFWLSWIIHQIAFKINGHLKIDCYHCAFLTGQES